MEVIEGQGGTAVYLHKGGLPIAWVCSVSDGKFVYIVVGKGCKDNEWSERYNTRHQALMACLKIFEA